MSGSPCPLPCTRLYARAVRISLGKTFVREEKPTPDAVLWTYGFDKPSTIMRRKRLMYLSRFLVHAPLELRAWSSAVHMVPGSWSTLVVRDLQWLKLRSPSLERLPDPAVAFEVWVAHIVSVGPKWAKIVRCACENVVEEDSDAVCSDVAGESERIQQVTCPYCSASFSQGSALTSHLRKMHNYRCLTHCHLNMEGDCCSCLKRIRAPVRLRKHFADCGRCLRNLVVHGFQQNPPHIAQTIADSAQSQTSSLLKQGRYAAFAALPVFQLQGPLLPTAQGPWNSRGYVLVDDRLQRLSFSIRKKRARESAL